MVREQSAGSKLDSIKIASVEGRELKLNSNVRRVVCVCVPNVHFFPPSNDWVGKKIRVVG